MARATGPRFARPERKLQRATQMSEDLIGCVDTQPLGGPVLRPGHDKLLNVLPAIESGPYAASFVPIAFRTPARRAKCGPMPD
jgi:hypothetical protein